MCTIDSRWWKITNDQMWIGEQTNFQPKYKILSTKTQNTKHNWQQMIIDKMACHNFDAKTFSAMIVETNHNLKKILNFLFADSQQKINILLFSIVSIMSAAWLPDLMWFWMHHTGSQIKHQKKSEITVCKTSYIFCF